MSDRFAMVRAVSLPDALDWIKLQVQTLARSQSIKRYSEALKYVHVPDYRLRIFARLVDEGGDFTSPTTEGTARALMPCCAMRS